MKAYVAGWFGRRDELIEFARRMTDETGIECTSRWLGPLVEEGPGMRGWMDGERAMKAANAAHIDLFDVKEADLLVVFPVSGHGAGHNVELGYAIGLGRKVLCVGEPTSVFNYHDLVSRVETDDQAISWLTGYAKAHRG